ncbi:MAG: hypothetical protein HY062_01740 [Bacteroidetes bacterium]|nr:hypothetical protein [Bacteroidota bacterium]
MQRREEVIVKPGFEYDHYFPKAKLITIRKKKGATVADTLLLIPAVVRETLFHTKRFALAEMKASTLEQTCRNIWQFVTDHIAYKKDEDGKEQVRSPARAWHDRHNADEKGEQMGVDCDCYTVFISSILSNLNIKHKLRITKYSENHFQHIYPIVPLDNGKYITIDCVVRSFDYEEPYTEKKDTDMDLEYLNGVPDTNNYRTGDSQDFMGLMGEQEALSELGKIFKRKAASGGGGGAPKKKGLFKKKPAPEGGTQKKGAKIKNFLKKGLHITNRLNPATATLRAGILAAMKINFMKIGEQMRYAYLTEDQARQKGLLMDRYAKMKNIREKLEKIFYGAGGKPENLKKAILTGRGNRNKEVPVNGLGELGNVDGLNEDMPLSQLLGREMYLSESMDGIDGLGELGEPATAATIAAATTVLTTIAALIKSVGSLVPKKKAAGGEGGGGDSGGGESGGGESGGDSGGGNESTNDASTNESKSNDSGASDSGSDNSSSNESEESTNGSTNKPANKTSGSGGSTSNDSGDGSDESDGGESGGSGSKTAAKTSGTSTTTKPTFWENNKKWIKPVGIGIGSLGLIALIYQIFKPKPETKTKPALNGLPQKKRKSRKNLLSGTPNKAKKGGNHSKKGKAKKKLVTLL